MVGDDADAELLFGGVQAEEGEAEEQGEGLGEEGDCQAGDETWEVMSESVRGSVAFLFSSSCAFASLVVWCSVIASIGLVWAYQECFPSSSA